MKVLSQRIGGYNNALVHEVPGPQSVGQFLIYINVIPVAQDTTAEAYLYVTTRFGNVLSEMKLWEDSATVTFPAKALLHGARILNLALKPVLELQLPSSDVMAISFADCTRLAIGFMKREEAAVEARFATEFIPPEQSKMLVDGILVEQQPTYLEQATFILTMSYLVHPSAELGTVQLKCQFDPEAAAHIHALNQTMGLTLSGMLILCEGVENPSPVLIMSKAWITLPYAVISQVVGASEPLSIAEMSIDAFFNVIHAAPTLETDNLSCRSFAQSGLEVLQIRTLPAEHPVQYLPSRIVPFLGSLTPPQAENLVFRVPGDGPAVQNVYLDLNYQIITASLRRAGLVQNEGGGRTTAIHRFAPPDINGRYPPIDSGAVSDETLHDFREHMRVKVLKSLDVINQTSLTVGTRIRFTYPQYAWPIICGDQATIPLDHLPRLANDSDVSFSLRTYFNLVQLEEDCQAIESTTLEVADIPHENALLIDLSQDDHNLVKFAWPVRYIPQSQWPLLDGYFEPKLWHSMYTAPIGSVELLDGMNQVISAAQVRLPSLFGPRIDHHPLLISWGTHRQFSTRIRYSRSFFARSLWASSPAMADELVYGSHPGQRVITSVGEPVRYVDDDHLYLRGVKSVCQDTDWARKWPNFFEEYPYLQGNLSCRIFPDAPTFQEDYGYSTSEPSEGTPVLTGYEAKDAITFQPLLKVQPSIYERLHHQELQFPDYATFGTRLFVTIGDTCWPNHNEEAGWIRKSNYVPMDPTDDNPAITRSEDGSSDVCDVENTPHYEYFIGFKVPYRVKRLIPSDSDWSRPLAEGPAFVDEGSIASSFDHKHIILPTDPGKKHVENSTAQCRIGASTPYPGGSVDAKPLPLVYYTTSEPSRVLAVSGRSAHPNATSTPRSFAQGFGIRLSSLVFDPTWANWSDYAQSQFIGDQALTISLSGLRHLTNQNGSTATLSAPERLARVNKLRLLSVRNESQSSLADEQVEDYEPPLPPHLDRLELKEEIPLSQLAGSARSIDIWTGSALADFCAGFTNCETCLNHQHTCHWAEINGPTSSGNNPKGCFWRFADLPLRTPVAMCEVVV